MWVKELLQLFEAIERRVSLTLSTCPNFCLYLCSWSDELALPVKVLFCKPSDLGSVLRLRGARKVPILESCPLISTCVW